MEGLKIRRLGLAVIPILVAATVNADTLILRDGRRIDGQLISYQNGVIEFQEGGFAGRSARVSKDEVVGVEFSRVDRPQAPQAPQSQRPRGMRERQVMVVANAAWTDMGIDLTAGQSIYFEPVGEIMWGTNRKAAAGGQDRTTNPARPIPNRPGGSLIAKIGASSDPFFIGDDRGAFRIRNAGRLFLGINDDYFQDNTGYFRVTVYY